VQRSRLSSQSLINACVNWINNVWSCESSNEGDIIHIQRAPCMAIKIEEELNYLLMLNCLVKVFVEQASAQNNLY